tara:strand:+ start:13 stop:861 length:849 start_codon:yes stop_codon:yes gene_type:complete
MFNLSTKSKFIIGSLISKILIFFLGNKKRLIERKNIKYEIDLKEGIDLGIFLGIKNEKNFFKIKNYIDPKKKNTIIDIGANIGSVSLPLAKLFHSSTIISVEPTYYAFSKLKKNLNLNPIFKKRIRIYNSFISNKKRKINFIHSSWNFSSNSKKHKVHRGVLKQASNKIQSLSKLIKKQKRKIDLIKIDVDGYEIDVLRSGKGIINKYKPVIYFEFAPYLYKEFGYSSKILINFIKKDMSYLFFDENFNEVKNINEIAKNLSDRSRNFFLIHKKNISNFKYI